MWVFFNGKKINFLNQRLAKLNRANNKIIYDNILLRRFRYNIPNGIAHFIFIIGSIRILRHFYSGLNTWLFLIIYIVAGVLSNKLLRLVLL